MFLDSVPDRRSFNTLQRKRTCFYTVLSALCFSTLEMYYYYLIRSQPCFFFTGLGSFLIAQIFYIITFFRMSNKPYPSRVGWLLFIRFVILLAILYPECQWVWKYQLLHMDFVWPWCRWIVGACIQWIIRWPVDWCRIHSLLWSQFSAGDWKI